MRRTANRAAGRPRTLSILLLAVVSMLLFAPSALAQDSKGTDFWLGFMTNYSGGPELSLFITGDQATTGTVSGPGAGGAQAFSVTPGTVTTVTLPSTAMMDQSGTVQDKGIHVTAGKEVTVYGLNRIQFTTDAFLGLPNDADGTDYYVLGYKTTLGGLDSEFAIVATADNTHITYLDSNTGTPTSIVLNQGQTYQLREAPDVSGTHITSDKPISVYGGNQCTDIPQGFVACDHVVEQLPPTTAWGTSFLSMPLKTRQNGDTFRIMASQDGTTVSVNGSPVATLNAGQFDERIISGPTRITGNKPLLVMQYSNSTSYDNVTSDPFQMMIPPFEQYQSSYTITTPASGFALNFVNVVAPNSAVGAVKLDGVPIPAGDYTPIPGSSFSGTQQDISVGSHTLSSPQPFGVHTYGFASADSYGYPGGLSLSEVATVTKVALAPKTATNPVNTEHCVTATVTDQHDAPVNDIRVDFSTSGANSKTGFSNTDSAGHAVFCYTGTNPGDDTITAAVGTLNDTAKKTWTSAPPSDTTAPTCVVTAIRRAGPGGHDQQDVTVRDTGSGLASITAVVISNGTAPVPAFTSGTTSPVIVTATKTDQTKKTTWQFQATDVAGNTRLCK